MPEDEPLRSGDYRIVYDDGMTRAMASFPRPARLPEAGDVYEAKEVISTIAPHTYALGDRFKVMERTRFAPHHRTSSLGNLIIRCKYAKSIWTEFDAAVALGRVLLVQDDDMPKEELTTEQVEALAQQKYPRLANRAMARKLVRGDALDLVDVGVLVEGTEAFPILFHLPIYYREMDYCHTPTELWVWSIWECTSDGRILATFDPHFKGASTFRCLWVR